MILLLLPGLMALGPDPAVPGAAVAPPAVTD